MGGAAGALGAATGGTWGPGAGAAGGVGVQVPPAAALACASCFNKASASSSELTWKPSAWIA